MSADAAGDAAGADTWRVQLRCNRIEAELLPYADDLFADMAVPPTLLTDEPNPAKPDDWLLYAYFPVVPTAEQVARLYAVVPSAPPGSAVIEFLPAQDWVTISQAGLEPVVAGRFHVHTAAHAATRRPGQIGLCIEASLAFGTGQHMTTHGCLTMIDRLAHRARFANILDLGTGTGVLAIAAAKRWRCARVIASDIDPVSADISRANVGRNRERLGRTAGRIEIVAAKGMHHRRLAARAPYDLIIANILAAPLVGLAGPISAALAPGGTLLLAGLLDSQQQAVEAAYRARGLRVVARLPVGEWPTLMLRN
jgi:ribosomal protein L11 methyltransferase